ncbi:UNVERIFIED_ORG: hypothetical protein M2348_004068 [Sphingomonas sp. R1F5B]
MPAVLRACRWTAAFGNKSAIYAALHHLCYFNGLELSYQ